MVWLIIPMILLVIYIVILQAQINRLNAKQDLWVQLIKLQVGTVVNLGERQDLTQHTVDELVKIITALDIGAVEIGAGNERN